MKKPGRPVQAPVVMRNLDFASGAWLRLTPAQRLRRSWRLRRRIPDLQAVHDAKLWPKLP